MSSFFPISSAQRCVCLLSLMLLLDFPFKPRYLLTARLHWLLEWAPISSFNLLQETLRGVSHLNTLLKAFWHFLTNMAAFHRVAISKKMVKCGFSVCCPSTSSMRLGFFSQRWQAERKICILLRSDVCTNLFQLLTQLILWLCGRLVWLLGYFSMSLYVSHARHSVRLGLGDWKCVVNILYLRCPY